MEFARYLKVKLKGISRTDLWEICDLVGGATREFRAVLFVRFHRFSDRVEFFKLLMRGVLSYIAFQHCPAWNSLWRQERYKRSAGHTTVNRLAGVHVNFCPAFVPRVPGFETSRCHTLVDLSHNTKFPAGNVKCMKVNSNK